MCLVLIWSPQIETGGIFQIRASIQGLCYPELIVDNPVVSILGQYQLSIVLISDIVTQNVFNFSDV